MRIALEKMPEEARLIGLVSGYEAAAEECSFRIYGCLLLATGRGEPLSRLGVGSRRKRADAVSRLSSVYLSAALSDDVEAAGRVEERLSRLRNFVVHRIMCGNANDQHIWRAPRPITRDSPLMVLPASFLSDLLGSYRRFLELHQHVSFMVEGYIEGASFGGQHLRGEELFAAWPQASAREPLEKLLASLPVAI